MADDAKFEEALIRLLDQGQIDKAKLKTTSAAIVALKKQGFIIDQINIKGKPRPDRIIINGIPDPDFFKKFKGGNINLKQFKLFPYGILNPEGFRLQAILNAQ